MAVDIPAEIKHQEHQVLITNACMKVSAIENRNAKPEIITTTKVTTGS